MLSHGKKGRLPRGLHPELNGVSTDADVRAKIAAAIAVMNAVAPATHYARRLKTTGTPPPATSPTTNDSFTMVQFNLLAEGLSSGPPAVPPFDDASKRGAFGGYGCPNPNGCPLYSCPGALGIMILLCCAVLCRGVLCRGVLCCAVLCRAVL